MVQCKIRTWMVVELIIVLVCDHNAPPLIRPAGLPIYTMESDVAWQIRYASKMTAPRHAHNFYIGGKAGKKSTKSTFKRLYKTDYLNELIAFLRNSSPKP